MAWEVIEKRQSAKYGIYGDEWSSVPAIAITKNGLSFNEPFVNAFINGHKNMVVLVDKQSRKIGLKLPTAQDEDNGLRDAFSLMKASGKRSKKNVRHLQLPRVPQAFPDCKGRAFRAHLNSGERVIEIDLSPRNQIK